MGIASLERSSGTFERRTSPENPSTSLSNPAPWLTEALGGAPTTSGILVNEKKALEYAAAFACINVLSKDIAQLPVFVYQRKGDERVAARDHDVWKLLHDRPNPMMTPFSFKQSLQAHACSWGNGYAEIEYTKGGKPLALWPLLPDRTKPVIRDGEKFYVTRVKEADGTERNVGLKPDQVLHVPGLSFDGITGYSVIRLARNAIGAGMAAEEFTARLFSNGASPRIALKTDKKLSPEARVNLKLSWDAAYSGLSNAHRTAILEEGLAVEKIGLPAKDQELIESSQFSIEQMARFFDIPLMRLHSTSAITSWGTGLEQWQRAYLTHTLGPWLVQWEEACNWSLFSEADRVVYFAEFLREALLQADVAARGQFYMQLLNVGAISPNQIARKENLPVAGKEGDERFIPLNMVPLSRAVELLEEQTKLDGGAAGKTVPPANPGDTSNRGLEPVAPPINPSPDATSPDTRARKDFMVRQQRSAESRRRMQASYRRVYEQAAGRVVTKLVAASRRAVERLEKDENVPAFQRWAREFFEKERPFIQDAFLPTTIALGELVAADVLASIGSHANFQREVERFAQSYVEALAVRESNRNSGQLIALAAEGATDEGTVVERLAARLSEWEEKRAGQVAQRESVQAGNATARHVYELSGVSRLMWVAAGSETCEMCQSLDGKVVSVERPFAADGETISGGDKSIAAKGDIRHPPAHRGCVCVLVAA